MAKRPAQEPLEDMAGVASPAPKRRRSESPDGQPNGGRSAHGLTKLANGDDDDDKDEKTMKSRDETDAASEDDEDDEDDTDAAPAAPIRQAAPTAGYDDLYLDTIDRQVLDFDFEKLCSISLSNINVYACLVCGRYFQGRGTKSHAYFHALDEDHHVYINMQTQRVYVLPEGYEVLSRSLDDIKFVADPRYTKADVAKLDRGGGKDAGKTAAKGDAAAAQQPCYTLAGKPYTPGFVGMNNIKENDYLNVVVQALAHVPPLRNFFLLDEFASTANSANANAELVRRFGLLVRKIWNPRAFKAHVSPHELLQEVALRSNKRFTLTAQSDPVDFLTWFLNHLHLGLGGSRTRPGTSMVQRVFQGRLRVESETLEAVGAAAAAAKAAEEAGQQQREASPDAMQIDTAIPSRPALPSAPANPFHLNHHQAPPSMLPPPPPPPGITSSLSSMPPPPPGVGSSSAFGALPPPPGMPLGAPPSLGPPGVSPSPSSSLLPPPPPPPSSSVPPPGVEAPAEDPDFSDVAAGLPKPALDVNRFLLLTLDLPAAPLFQDEQERNIIPQVPLTTLLAKYDGQSAREQGDVRRRFRLRAPLPPFLVLHMKRFSANKFVAERNPTIVTFDPKGLDMRPYVEDDQGREVGDGSAIMYDLVANVVHEAVRVGGDDVAVDSAEEKRTWKVQVRDRGAKSTPTTAGLAKGQDQWYVMQDLFVEPVSEELLYLAESYIQIWERRRVPGSGGDGGARAKGKGKVNGGSSSSKR